MRKRLLRWLACPLCHGDLGVREIETHRRPLHADDRAVLEAVASTVPLEDAEADVETGALVCTSCRVYYPIHRGVPRMLTYPTAVARLHAEANADWIRDRLGGFALPASLAPPGEEAVLRSFSTEWTEYEWNGSSYWTTTPEAWLGIKRYELGVARHPLRHRGVLEVGIGIGGTADALSRTEDCEVVGVDLSYAVDQARRYFVGNPRLHIVQASVFALPFRPASFDVVYSHGVLHHTHSTRRAFAHLARLPQRPHGMLYVWLYAHAAERGTPLRRLLMLSEQLVRPWLAQLPAAAQTALLAPTVPAYMLYQNVYRRRQLGPGVAARYGWNEALHAARDRLTPPFAHRHTYEEVGAWFAAEGYTGLEFLRDEPRPEGVDETFPLNVGVRGFRLTTAQAG